MSSRDKEKLVRKLSRPGGVGAPVVKTPKKVKDLSHLTDEERKRREEQREKGRIAREERERREKGGDAQEHRHPLNSERRRANKRRPSKGMRAAAAKKLKREEDGARGEWRKG